MSLCNKQPLSNIWVSIKLSNTELSNTETKLKKIIAYIKKRVLHLNDSNGIWTHNHLPRKRTLNHLATG